MGQIVNEIVKSRKTFFIAPDKDLISEYFLEDYLAKDYECYFVEDDLKQPLDVKVQVILSIFTDAIIFFNIDYHIEGLEWFTYIQRLCNEHPRVCFGVMYAKRKTLAEKASIEHKYLYNIGLAGGCIQLEYQKNINFVLIERVLFANQAMGRRKNVRAVCTKNCQFTFLNSRHENITFPLNDVSVSHFSITLTDLQAENLKLKEYEKIQNLCFTIKGMRFVSDAILYMKRPTPEGNLFVFAFVSDTGKIGLDQFKKKLIVQKMYEIMHENCTSLIETNCTSKMVPHNFVTPPKKAYDFDPSVLLEDF
ncbi:MAG: hypothetical protein K6A43_12380 [Treponema sp.]|nr:hypothetical protein [Treponema sp.]